MYQSIIIVSVIAATITGDYMLKIASENNNFLSVYLILGVIFYALPAFGWMHLMKTQSLAHIGVIYSAGTIIALFVLSFFVFREALSTRDLIAGLLAICAILAYTD